MTLQKHPPLDRGTKVKTLAPNYEIKNQWTEEGWKNKKWGVEGKIIDYHDSNGLYYEVQHDDTSIAGYDPLEIEVI